MKLLAFVLLLAAAGLARWFDTATTLAAAIATADPTFVPDMQRNAAPWLWTNLLTPPLGWPAWALPAGFGTLFGLLAVMPRR